MYDSWLFAVSFIASGEDWVRFSLLDDRNLLLEL